MIRSLASLLAIVALAACDQVSHRLGLEDPAAKEAKADAEGRAVGSGCRQSGRAIEDCYAIYGWLPKASIFAGWREMNDYMLANKLEVVEPKLPPPSGPGAKKKRAEAPEAAEQGTKPAEGKPETKGDSKAEAKPEGKPAEKEGAKPAAGGNKAAAKP